MGIFSYSFLHSTRLTISEQNYPVVINYNQSLQEMISNSNYHNVVDTTVINSTNFPSINEGEVAVALVLVDVQRYFDSIVF